MKKLFFMSLFVFAVFVGASAQQKSGKKHLPPEKRVEMRVQHLTSNLGLSEDQKAKLRTILEVDTVRPASREDAVQKRMVTEEKIKSLLTDEQKTKFDEMKNKKGEKKMLKK